MTYEERLVLAAILSDNVTAHDVERARSIPIEEVSCEATLVLAQGGNTPSVIDEARRNLIGVLEA